MKTLTKNKITKIALALVTGVVIQGCSSVKIAPPPPAVVKNTPPLSLIALPPFLMSPMYPVSFPLLNFEVKVTNEIRISVPPKYENFENIAYPNEAFVIANMIAVVQPELDEKERDAIANHISIASRKFDIDPKIFVSIIDTESNFQENLVSSTGDLSVAQINVDVWNKEFLRLKMPTMKKEHIMSDCRYAIMKMGEILQIIKKRHAKVDQVWYARYHSNTLKYKSDYLGKLQLRMKMLAKSKSLNNQIAQLENLKILSGAKSANMSIQAAQNGIVSKTVLKLIPLPTPKVETGLMLEVHRPFPSTKTATLLLKEFSPRTVYE
ncbi:MAG: transglycosylase SLT domain-containing protein [Bdellovibrionales bacterium]|nr:transglycosylase SLT domain-containing protein [Bdellovibrionales bacterium]